MSKKPSPTPAVVDAAPSVPLPQSGGVYVLENNALKPALNEASSLGSNAPETEG
jgi:hypothetical protein